MGLILPEPESALAGGLILGTRQALGEELQNDFRKTGLIHIVVLSGYNVAIVADTIVKIFSFLPRTFGAASGVLGIVLFAVVTGGTATVVRASVMAVLVVIARTTGREYQIARALFLAAFLMILENPLILLFDISFQLSFLATLALIVLAPHVERLFFFIPEVWNFRELASATVSTQIFVLPLLMYSIGEVSLVAPIVNLLVLPIIPITMLFGFLTALVAFLSNALALTLGYVAHILLSYELLIVEWFSSIPFVAVSVPAIPVWTIFIMYAIYALILWKVNRSKVVYLD